MNSKIDEIFNLANEGSIVKAESKMYSSKNELSQDDYNLAEEIVSAYTKVYKIYDEENPKKLANMDIGGTVIDLKSIIPDLKDEQKIRVSYSIVSCLEQLNPKPDNEIFEQYNNILKFSNCDNHNSLDSCIKDLNNLDISYVQKFKFIRQSAEKIGGFQDLDSIYYNSKDEKYFYRNSFSPIKNDSFLDICKKELDKISKKEIPLLIEKSKNRKLSDKDKITLSEHALYMTGHILNNREQATIKAEPLNRLRTLYERNNENDKLEFINKQIENNQERLKEIRRTTYKHRPMSYERSMYNYLCR